MSPDRNIYSCTIAVSILLFAISTMLAQPRTHLKLNDEAFAFARQLVKEGHFVADSKGAWNDHRPSPDDENEFVRLNGFSEYAKWHLGIDDRYPENTKRRYKISLRRLQKSSSLWSACCASSGRRVQVL
jgi:hypothetical protein